MTLYEKVVCAFECPTTIDAIMEYQMITLDGDPLTTLVITQVRPSSLYLFNRKDTIGKLSLRPFF